MGSFSAQALALFAVLAPGCLFFLSFHYSKGTVKLDLQRGVLLDTALFVLAAAVLHLTVGLIVLYAADYWASCNVVRSTAALASAREIVLAADEKCSVHLGILLFTLHIALVGFAAVLAGRLTASYVSSRPSLFGALYGPYYDPPVKGSDERVIVIANVMTDVEHEGKILMYEGKLEEIALSGSKTINYVCLRGAQRFFMDLSGAEPKTSTRNQFRPVDRDPLPPSRLLIHGENIKNVLTRTYRVSGIPIDEAAEHPSRRQLIFPAWLTGICERLTGR